MQASPPQTIDEIIAALNVILDKALREGERIGYFAALYERVTTNVRRALVAGNVFQDNARMERLDVVFASRFLHAWEQHCAGAQPSRSWQVAFGALDDPTPLVVQHLLLGMNAHINLDLGIAAATVAPSPAELESLWPDFKKINEVLSRLVRVVEDELAEISPRLARIEEIAPALEDRIFDFGIDVARDFAWALARDLAQSPADQWPRVISQRDVTVAELGGALYPLHGLAGIAERWIREKESNDIRYNIQVVAE
ncbi:MAG TPA: DUF5995 family protein [Longimicrobium sp.]|jgi:hypothetical protein